MKQDDLMLCEASFSDVSALIIVRQTYSTYSTNTETATLSNHTGCLKKNFLLPNLALANIAVDGEKSNNTVLTNPYETRNTVVKTNPTSEMNECFTLKLVKLVMSLESYQK